jgi:ADP-dependent NAD(P)H-hydrate dehydratase / NAD(P)H-hydrate epimerase
VKIFSTSQIKEWDKYTIDHEPISSVELMERAANACFNWIRSNYENGYDFLIFCGKGNNGGDGLVISRLLLENKYNASAFIVGTKSKESPDFTISLQKLEAVTGKVTFIRSAKDFPVIPRKNVLIIDALFGTGLNKPLTGIFSQLITHLNTSDVPVISIDLPSGLFADKSSKGNVVIKSKYTLSFQQPKLAFFMKENAVFCGEPVILDIGLSPLFYQKQTASFELSDINLIREIYKPPSPFAHKGNFGYACLIAGSYGMMGAAVLCARACLRAGTGKLTVFTCRRGYEILQISVPEAMCRIFGNNFIEDIGDLKAFDVVGIGPGIGQPVSHKKLFQKIFKEFKKPVVIDADALNMLGKFPTLHKKIPPYSLLTPHPKEFERLFGKTQNDFEQIELALKKSRELKIYIALKGHFTFIATPEGKGYFNSTGNPGMATAGSGDVLTGILTGLIARNYSSMESILMGVYLHGLAGDLAAKKYSEEAMLSGDIVESLGDAYKKIRNLN